jgi:cytochrome c-type biogenesis protein CcmF
MSPTLGFALLLLTFSASIFLPIFNFIALKKIKGLPYFSFVIPAQAGIQKSFETLDSRFRGNDIEMLQKISFALTCGIFFAAVFSQLCLIFSFVISDYSVTNVYQNSHHLKPLIYKISGSWGNHEGSMLLLISILSAYTFAFNFFSKIDLEKKLIITSSQSLIISLLTAFTAFTSNPFARIFPVPEVGLGLNPLLQDIGLALHPPMLYTGYIGFSLIFSFAIAGLLSEKVDRKFAAHLKNWLFFSYGFLTLGIGLGAWWAYRELGWGGYWFWDPVENVSLMPWIAATALVHCLKLLEQKEICKIWTVFLAILTFILCLLGLFLVRSGILTSVHSFAIDASRASFIIAIILLIGGGGLLIFGAKMHHLKTTPEKLLSRYASTGKFSLTSRASLISLNNYFLIVALFIVLLGTLYPIFSRGFFDQFISIGPNYYNKIFSILIIPFLIFMAIASFGKKMSVTMALAHLGFFFVILGVTLSSFFGAVKEVNLKKTESLKIAGYEIKFNDVEYFAGKNFLARQGDFTILKNGKELGKLTPQLRYYHTAEQTTNETSIRHQIFSDLYLVIGNKDEKENYAVRAYYKPFIFLIWMGCGMIFLAVVFGIKKSKHR